MTNSYRLRQAALIVPLLVLGSYSSTPAQSISKRIPNVGSTKDRPELIAQLGHVGPVLNVAVSRDGRFLLTGGDFSVFLWDTATAQVVRAFGGKTLPVAVAFSPDGGYVLTGGMDKNAYLWETATGREVKKFEGHDEKILAVAFAPDGRSVMTGSDDGTVRLWSVSNRKEVGRFPEVGEVLSVAYSSDGRFAVTGALRNSKLEARLWNVETCKEVRPFGDGGFATFSPDGRFVLVAGEVTTMYESATGNKVRDFKGSGKVRFSPDGRYVLTPGKFTGVEGVNIDTGERLGADTTAQLWDAASGDLVHPVEAKGGFTSADFSPDGRFFVLGTEKGVSYMFDADTAHELRRFEGYADRVRSAWFSSDGRYMTTESVDSFTTMGFEQITRLDYSLWNFATGRQTRRIAARSEDDSAAQKEARATCDSEEDALLASQFSAFAFSPNGNLIVTGHCKFARLRDVATGRELRRFEGFEGRVGDISFSPDGQVVALAGEKDRAAKLVRVEDGTVVTRLVLPENIAPKGGPTDGGQIVHFLPDGRFAVATGEDVENGYAFVWDTKTWKPRARIKLDENVTFSSDYRLYVKEATEKGTATLHDTITLKELKSFAWKVEEKKESDDEESGMEVMDKKVSPDGRLMATGSVHYTENINPHAQRQLKVCLLDVETGKNIRCLNDPATSFSFTPDSRFLVTSSYDRTTRLWDVSTGLEACRLLSFRDGTWVAVTPDGRFDTNNLESIPGLHWVFPDEPLRSLPIEIFLRDYFEPRLLPRVVGGASFNPIRPLASLNRAQPRVRIVEVAPEPGRRDRAALTVEVEQGDSASTRTGRRVTLRSAAYDLHLFRDGQLVARWPDPNANAALRNAASPRNSSVDLTVWRQAHRINLNPATGKRRLTFHNVELPQRTDAKQVEFTAYAFNSDRVKSATSAPRVFQLSNASVQMRGRAYVITIGVNANESDWNLDFAVQSARDVQQLLHDKLAQQYEVIDVQLLSALEPDSPRIAIERATKPNIQAVLDLLAGRPVGEPRRNEIDPNRQLRRATPDDLVFLFISSHGYADPQGNFYVIPSDTGGLTGITEESLNRCLSRRQTANCVDAGAFLARSISSDDLANWWKDINAGEILMILDSCHSAAVPGREFRPGPLGDRGFGQLSYDKGMRILTATQPDKRARATLLQGLGHSLLTQALISASRAGQKMSLADWLQEAERAVPELYKSLYPGIKETEVQYPVLLDFTRNRKPMTAQRQ